MANKVTEEMRKALREPLPQEAVKQHPTKTYLSSIKAIYVTERLNDVFGVGSYKIKTQQIGEVNNGMVVCKVSLEIPEYDIYLESFGGNDNGGEGNKNFDLGDAYKGATTDAITKICSWLEIGIDVFKGKVTTQQKPQQQNNDLPWLNEGTQEWDNVVGALLANKCDMKYVTSKFKVSKTSKTKLEQLITK